MKSYALTLGACLLASWCGAEVSETTNQATAHELCQHLKDIRTLPLKASGPGTDYTAIDSVSDQMRSPGGSGRVLPDRQITEVNEMNDPRHSPVVGRVKVGDVAFWVVLDITGLPYDDMFPADLRKRFATEGTYAYFEWVKNPKHRRQLQKNVRNWYERNHAVALSK